MLESIGPIFDRMNQIHKRIEQISKLPSNLPIRRIQPRQPKPEEKTDEKTPKFSDVLQQVLEQKNAQTNTASSTGVNEVVGTQKENADLLKTLYTKNEAGIENLTIDQTIQKAASRYGVDANLIRGIIQQESGFSTKALSSKGAMGLMQLMPGTADLLGVKDAFNPYENIMAGTRYFKLLMNKYDGDLGRSLAAYNAGANRVDAAGGIPDIQETRDYVRKVMGFYQKFRIQPKTED